MNILHTNTANLIFLLQSQNEKFLRFKGLFGRRKCRVICCPYFYTSPWWIAHGLPLYEIFSHKHWLCRGWEGGGWGGEKKTIPQNWTQCPIVIMIFFLFFGGGEDFEGVGVLVGRSFINHSESSLFKSFK